MYFFKTKLSSPDYTSIAHYKDSSEDSDTGREKRFSSEADHSLPLLESTNERPIHASSVPINIPKIVIYLSLGLVLLSAVNIAILPATLSKYLAHPFTESGLRQLPYGDDRLGLDRVAEAMPDPPVYHRGWPDKIARVSRKLKGAVWGQGVQVYITVEDSTLMRFPIPSHGTDICALSWKPPPDSSARLKDLTTKGEITEIEVWQLIATSTTTSRDMNELDYDTLSYATMPVRGELLGVLDITAKPNSTTVEFACPSEEDHLVVELRCQRVACHVSFMQVEFVPRFGFELLRRRE